MTTVVVDSTNLEQVLADAEKGIIPRDEDILAAAAKPEPAKPNAEAKPAATTEGSEADDVEDEDGLTPRQKRELTAKMIAAIGKKHRNLKDAEEFAAEQYNTRRLAEQRAQLLETELRRLQEAAKPQPKPEETKPDRAKFQSDEEYRDALINWEVEQRFRAREAQANKEREEARQAEILRNASARVAKAIELVPDFQEVTEAVDWPTPPAVAGYMQESEMFAELGYYLAQHSEARQKLDSLRPAAQLVEIGKIESTLKPFATDAKVNGNGTEKPTATNGDQPSQTGTTPSRSRAPVITPLSAGSGAQVEKDEAEMTPQEALAAWQKRKHRNLTRRQRH